VLEYGTHEQLYVMGGEYRTRYDMYFAQTPWQIRGVCGALGVQKQVIALI
jgi:hypothetical protein